jgi:integrase/recombinase XerD
VLSLHRPLVEPRVAEHRVGMAAPASFQEPRELALAAVAHLSRYRGTSREHNESDLRVFFTWCHDRQLAPLTSERHDLEMYLRWLQDVRRYKPSTVSRRLSVVAGFYRTCVIDGVLEHSPADYVRRPSVPSESPTLGLTHLQFEAMLTAARESTNAFDFALVCLLGLLGLRIFETVGADIDDLGEEHGHRVLRVRGKGGKIVLVPLPPAVSRAVDRAAGERPTGPLLLNRRGVRIDRHAATAGSVSSRPSPAYACRGCTRTCSDTPSSPRCSTPESTFETCRSPPGTPTHGPRCATTARARTSTATRTTSWRRTWRPAHDRLCR